MTNRRVFFGSGAALALAALAAQPVAAAGNGYPAVTDAIAAYGMERWRNRILTIAYRESRFDPMADNGVCAGIFQFTWPTWLYACRLGGDWPGIKGDPQYDLRYGAYTNAFRAVHLMYLGQWSHWRSTDPGHV